MQTIIDARWPLFVKVADIGSVFGATAALDIPQSAVSARLARLAREKKVSLATRSVAAIVQKMAAAVLKSA